MLILSKLTSSVNKPNVSVHLSPENQTKASQYWDEQYFRLIEWIVDIF